MSKLFKKAGAVILVAGALTLATSVSAIADTSTQFSYSGHFRVESAFVSYGEHLKVTDLYNDGYGGRSQYHIQDGVSTNCDNSGGAGSTHDCDLSIPDGKYIDYNACMKDGSTTFYCGPSVIRDLA